MKETNIIFRVTEEEKAAFYSKCKKLGSFPSEELRRMMRVYINKKIREKS